MNVVRFVLALSLAGLSAAVVPAAVAATTFGPAARGQPDPARANGCALYARRQVETSTGSSVVGGAVRGALGGAIVGGIIDGTEGAGTGAAIGAGAGALAGSRGQRHDMRYRAYYNACMNSPVPR